MPDDLHAHHNSRLDYLRSVGLSTDPFLTSVAELELGVASDIPAFYSLYSPPRLKILSGRTIGVQDLRQAQHTVIYGGAGSGKTTLRLALEAECRTVLADELVVTYILGEDAQDPSSRLSHADRLARSMAIDIFIQSVERFDPRNYPSQEQIASLKKQIAVGGKHLRRLIKTLLDSPRPDARAGIGAYWAFLGRSPVRYIAMSQDLADLLNECIRDGAVSKPEPQGWESVWQAASTATLWGFKRILILVDSVDDGELDKRTIFRSIQPLLMQLKNFQKRNLHLKFFLPLELQDRLAQFMSKPAHLKIPMQEAKIEWTAEALRQLLTQRFRSAGSHYTGFNALVDKDFSLQVDQALIQKAARSPRQLLYLASALIDAHINHSPGESKIRKADWNSMLKITARFSNKSQN